MMRTKKATINASINGITFMLAFIPLFIVRKVFLDTLGIELLGLSSLYNNIIGYLSIVEMGIGTAIIFSLYKPFANNNITEIKGYLNFYKNFYRLAGFIILVLGLIIVPFLGVFINSSVNMFDARIYFILFIINTLTSYLFSYKLCLLNVAQQGYKISIGTTLSKLIIAILQIVFFNIYPSFYIYLIIQIVVNIIYFIIMNIYIDNEFNCLVKITGKITLEEKKSLIKNVKALFLHKIGGILVFGTDNIVISSFINLNAVAKFNSYNMVIVAIQGVLGTMMSAITPSIGNLLVDDNKETAYEVFKRLFFINFWIASFVIISLFNTITQFIKLWLGNSQVLSVFTISIILMNVYFQFMRVPVEQFKEAAGLYQQDRYAPIFEGLINLIFSIILVKLIGLPGVFIGTFLSNIIVIFWIKPMIVYKNIFKKPLISYFHMYFNYLLIGIIPLFITSFITNKIQNIDTILAFIVNCLINIIIINCFYFFIFRKYDEFKYFKSLIESLINKLSEKVIKSIKKLKENNNIK